MYLFANSPAAETWLLFANCLLIPEVFSHGDKIKSSR
jgi:hypothetical protein